MKLNTRVWKIRLSKLLRENLLLARCIWIDNKDGRKRLGTLTREWQKEKRKEKKGRKIKATQNSLRVKR